MSSAVDSFKRRMFWIVANACLTLYGAFPVFGTLRASLGVIFRDGKFLVIHRNDGRGICLPGGISNFREAAEVTLEREVEEETGLKVSSQIAIEKFYSKVDFPCNISLFRVETNSGEVKNSWEGSPRWLTVEELEPELVESQRPVLEVFRKIAAQAEQNLHKTPPPG